MPEHRQKIPYKIPETDAYEISDHAVLSKYPLVSVVMITYSHESYIAQAIQGVLMQKRDFPVELIIGEDCSTDRTREIVLDYQKKYPEMIRVISSDKNVGMMNNSYRTIAACRGKYIAICEGDDYWTDPLKLQKQADFLEANEDCSLCFHATEFVHEDRPEKNFIHRPKKIPDDFKFEMKHAILGGGGFMATNSMFFKRECLKERPDWMDKAPVGDAPLMLLLASQGEIAYIDEVMSAYRVMIHNSWSSSMQNVLKRKQHHHAVLRMWDAFDEWSQKKYHNVVLIKKMKNNLNYLKEIISIFFKKRNKDFTYEPPSIR